MASKDCIGSADCGSCPLARFHNRVTQLRPLQLEINNPDAPLIILPEPSKRSMELGIPLMGEEGLPVLRVIKEMGLRRVDFNYTYAVACRYPGGNSKTFNARLAKHNRNLRAEARAGARKRLRDDPDLDPDFVNLEFEAHEQLNPVVTCSGKLYAEAAMFGTVITMGKNPAAAFLGGSPKVEDIRGGPTIGYRKEAGHAYPIKVLPTVDPPYLLAKPAYEAIVKLDFEKALRYHNNALRWKNVEMIFDPSVDQINESLAEWNRRGLLIAADVETDSFEPMTANLRCFGMGVDDKVLVLGYQSVEDDKKLPRPLYLETPKALDWQPLIESAFTNPDITWVGQNFRVYDYMALENAFGIYPEKTVDTILLAHLADNELPRGLAFWGSILTDGPGWKAEHTAVTAKTDKELWTYNAIDIAVTSIIAPILLRKVREADQLHIYKYSKKLQDYSVGMHKLGMMVDNARLLHHYRTLDKQRNDSLTLIREIGGPKLNINSNQQFASFLFEDVGCPVLSWTAAGDPSVKSVILRRLRANPLVPDEIKVMISAVLNYRNANKTISTFIKPLSPLGYQVGFDHRTGYGKVHPHYNVTGTTAGRFSSNEPNFQNLPEWMRDIFVAGEDDSDDWYLYYDLDQLELRMVAALSNARLYKKILQGEPVFDRHFEPHNLTGYLVFGQGYFEKEGAPLDYRKKGTGKFAELRALIKTIYYLFQYGGGAERMLDSLMEAEKPDGTPLFADAFTEAGLPKVRGLLDKLKKAIPEIPEYWRQCHDFWRKHDYIEDPIWKRRRRFSNGFDPNGIVNHPAQAGGFAIAAEGLFRLEALRPFDFKNGYGLVTQTHDSGVYRTSFKGGADEKKAVLKQYEELITSKHLDMMFTGEAKFRKRWVDIDANESWDRTVPDIQDFDVLLNEKAEKPDDDDYEAPYGNSTVVDGVVTYDKEW